MNGMKLGILTLHDSTNYGAVLQACALGHVLRELGHDAAVVDRRRDPSGRALKTPFADETLLERALRFAGCTGAVCDAVRRRRTLRFLRDRVTLTPYAFSDWKDAPADPGVDAFVVGSDQVWNANNLDPADYLLLRAPAGVPGVSYAASIGMPSIPPHLVDVFRRGLGRFSALSVREEEAAETVRGLGFDVTRVADPVLLAGPDPWTFPARGPVPRKKKLFLYFLAEDVCSMLPAVSDFIRAHGMGADFFVDALFRPVPHGLSALVKNARFVRKWERRGVYLRLAAGPEDFVQALKRAEAVVSNSYHALMFALVFGKNVRIVRPSHPVRRAMAARMEEFSGTMVSGPLMHDDLRSALASLAAGEETRTVRDGVEELRASSRRWLHDAIDNLRA